MRPYLPALVLLSAALSACGPNFSGEHFAVVRGAEGVAAPTPSRFGPIGPRPDSGARPDLLPPPAGLPALTTAYRRHLREMAHPLPADLAEQFADVEIESLRRQYAGRDADLERELVRRLTAPQRQTDQPMRLPRRPLPGAYPPDEASSVPGGAS